MIKQRKDSGKCRDKKKKASQGKIRIQPESTGKRKKTKKISRKGKTIQTKQDIPKQWKEILSTGGGRWN